MTDRMPADAGASALGAYLKDRRERLDPAAFGFSSSRRRTPGLRREEVAQRADVSTTWYTWLEQGRGGAPSADALDRLARALSLSDVEREHLYLLGRGHPPELPRSGVPAGGVTSQLQSVLDAIESRPALITTSTWDIVAWNAVTARVFLDYSTIPVDQRNSLRFLFAPGAREHMADWEHHARSLVALFRAGAARSSDVERVAALVDELSRSSPEFAAMWREHDVAAPGPGTKRLAGAGGEIVFDYAMFAVHGHADLHMIVYTPATPVDAARLRERLSARDAVEGGDAAGRQRE